MADFNQFGPDGVYQGSFPLAWIAEKHGLSLDVVYNVAEGIKQQLNDEPPSVWSNEALKSLHESARLLGSRPNWGRTIYNDIFAHVYAWETRNLSQ